MLVCCIFLSISFEWGFIEITKIPILLIFFVKEYGVLRLWEHNKRIIFQVIIIRFSLDNQKRNFFIFDLELRNYIIQIIQVQTQIITIFRQSLLINLGRSSMRNFISHLHVKRSNIKSNNHSKNEKNDENIEIQIEVGNNQKIQHQFNTHKQIMKKLTTSSKAFQKISRCYFQIKTNVLSICEVLSADVFTGLSCNTGKILLENICQINASIADHCNEFSTQFQNMVSMYSEIAKDKQQKYKQQRTNYNHYSQKIQALHKTTDKDRFQRNKDKLKQAAISYDKTSNQFNLFLRKINEQTQKIWQKNFISFVSIFITKSEQLVQKVKQAMQNYHDQSDPSILIQQDIQINLSPANSLNQKEVKSLSQQIQKFLTKNYIHTEKILLRDYFLQHSSRMTEQQINANKKSNLNKMRAYTNDNFMGQVDRQQQGKNKYMTVDNFFSDNSDKSKNNNSNMNINVQKLFGVKSLKIQPVSFSNIMGNNTNKNSQANKSKGKNNPNQGITQFFSINNNKTNNFSSKTSINPDSNSKGTLNRNPVISNSKNQTPSNYKGQHLLKQPKMSNNFDCFQNVFCEKSKSPVQRPRQSTPRGIKFDQIPEDDSKIYSSTNVSHKLSNFSPIQNKSNKNPKQEVNLLDL